MPKQGVPLTGSVLAWARAESGLSQSEVAESLKVDRGVVESWESGTALPGHGDFSKLVKVLERPSAVFFLPEPPARSAVPTSFRDAPGLSDHRLGKDEIRWIRRSRRLQDLLSWIQRHGQSHHDNGHLAFGHYLGDGGVVLSLRAGTLQHFQRRGQQAFRIAQGQPNPPSPKVHTQSPHTADGSSVAQRHSGILPRGGWPVWSSPLWLDASIRR